MGLESLSIILNYLYVLKGGRKKVSETSRLTRPGSPGRDSRAVTPLKVCKCRQSPQGGQMARPFLIVQIPPAKAAPYAASAFSGGEGREGVRQLSTNVSRLIIMEGISSGEKARRGASHLATERCPWSGRATSHFPLPFPGGARRAQTAIGSRTIALDTQIG